LPTPTQIKDGIYPNFFCGVTTIISSMQSQDFHIQKIQRVANLINPDNDKFARAKHIVGDKHNNLVSDDELEALIALHNT
jgi:hypothetical protein